MKTLLICGIISSALYIVMNITEPMQWRDYNRVSQTISELSAIGAPTRPLWNMLALCYSLLIVAFALGIGLSAQGRKKILAIAIIIMIYGIIGLFWPPMHQREVLEKNDTTLTDTLHIIFAAATVLLMIVAILLSVSAFKGNFGVYSIVTMAILITFGIITSLDAQKLSANLPTPLMGVWERINVGAFMLWIAVLAIVLLNENNGRKPNKSMGI